MAQRVRAKRAIRELNNTGTYVVHVRSASKAATKRMDKAVDEFRNGISSLRGGNS